MAIFIKFLLSSCLVGAVISLSVIPKNTRNFEDCKTSSSPCYDQRLHPDRTQSLHHLRAPNTEAQSDYWLNEAKKFVSETGRRIQNKNIAKNVIFFLGDGMSLATVAAARNLLGGEEHSLEFEKFPYTGLSKTYCLDRKVPDSASTATAYLCGVKANYGTIGVDGRVRRKDCSMMLDESAFTPSIAKWAQDSGKATGIVTTTRVTHASPAGAYAHVADRGWENDAQLPSACPKGIDITTQLVHGPVGSKFKVILGGGRREFLNETLRDEEGYKGYRTDGKNLIQEWLDAAPGRKYVFNREGLNTIDAKDTDSLLGLFQDTNMLYRLEAEIKDVEDQKPTLEEMTRKAIEIVSKSDKGYFLFVEGGKIDLAHHSVYAQIALDETVEFSKAIQVAVNMTNEEDTLIVVTADHAHTMTYSGYPERSNNIFGVADISEEDNMPYLTLSYANGNGFDRYLNLETNSRLPLVASDADYYKQKFPSTIPLDTETHGGEDVGVYARGPWSHLFTGTFEQNLIPHLMAYAACIGKGLTACDGQE